MAYEIKTINDIFLCDVTARADIAKIVENYASKIYVDDKLSNLSLNVNLDAYATKTYVRQLIANSETKINISLSNYATKTYVDQEINKIQNNSGETPGDLSNYVSKSELEEANYVSYFDLYLQDENGNYIVDENENYMIERFASYNELRLLQKEVDALKQEIDDLKNNGGTQPEEPEIIYGNIIVSTSSLTINEGNTSNFTVKLDKAPTQQQIVNISIDNNNATINKTGLVFDSNNYNEAQTVSVSAVHLDGDYTDKTANIIISSNNVSNKLVKVSIMNIDTEPTPEPEPTLYTIVSNLTYMTSSNSNSTIESGLTYYTVLRPNTNYEIQSCTIKMNGIDITNTACSEQEGCYIINITNVTGNIEITAIAIATTVEPTAHSMIYTIPNGITIDNAPSTVENNSSYTAIIKEEEGYELSSISVTMNGIDITNEVVSDYNDEEIPPEEPSTGTLTLNPTSITFTEEYASKIITATLTGNLVGSTVTWMSSNTTVASVTNGGKVTALANGTCTITATCGTYSATCSVTVNIGSTGGEGGSEITGDLTIEPSSVTLSQYNESLNLTLYNNGKIISSDLAEWDTSDWEIVHVNNAGTITALADGSATITATCNGLIASCSVTVDTSSVVYIPCTNLTLNKQLLTFTDNTPQAIEATKYPENTLDMVLWGTSKEDVATVDNGVVTPVGNGTCTITAMCGPQTATCSVRVAIGQDNTVYTNPTVTYDATTNKAKLTEGSYIEYIDLSYEPNTGHADYVDSIVLSDGSQNHYLSLLKPESTSAISRFRINGNVPDTGGWFNRTGKDGYTYGLWLDPTLYYKDIDSIEDTTFYGDVNNVNGDSNYINEGLRIFSSMFPTLNLSLSPSSQNTITVKDLSPDDPSYLAATRGYPTHFSVELYSSCLTSSAGSYESNPKYWLAVLVHELGHSLGFDDGALHDPTIYSYDRDRSKCWYHQPNDIIAFKTFMSAQFGLDVVTTLENSCGISYLEIPLLGHADKPSIASLGPNDLIGIRYSYLLYEDPDKESDVIVEGKLHFEEEISKEINDGDSYTLYYNLYTIEPINILKGSLNNNKLKIVARSGINIDDEKIYELRLKNDKDYYILLNPSQGIIKKGG